MTEYRASFDADVTFSNGGGLTAKGFRLDIANGNISEDQLAEAFVRHLGLLMVESVNLENVSVFAEPHKGSRGGPADAAEKRSAERLIELNHVLRAGMTTYPGLPGPEITPHLTREASRAVYAEGTEFAMHSIRMVGNTGTYVDSPFHRYPDGADLSEIPLSSVANLPTVVVRLLHALDRGRAIDSLAFAPYELDGAAVLLHTGWDRHWGTDQYARNAPYLTAEGARHLVDAGVKLVGIDSVNIDNAVPGGERPAHSILLRAGVIVLEHLTGLEQLPIYGARLHAAPPRIREFSSFTVRAYAVVP
jgi:kynurenine formamidase